MKVATIYGPAQQDLERVEEALQSVKEVDDFPGLRRMLEHVLGAGGKRIRPAVAVLAGHFGDYRPDLLVPLAASIELLHTATLVHDDVIDGSMTRRGRATANALFDNAATVMLGDYMFACAAEFIARTNNIEVVKLFSRTLMSMASGELTQDMTAYDYGQDTMAYFRRISGKTASLFATSAQGGAMIAGAPESVCLALRSYGENLGMAFQIVDDILDFTGDEREMGKPVGSDLMQGTLTLPSLLLMERSPRDNPVVKLFKNRRRQEYVTQAIEMILASDIIPESYDVARDFHDRAIAALEPLPDGPAKTALIDIADYVMERRS